MARVARTVATTALALTTLLTASACTRVIDDARVVAGPDLGKAAATASDCTKVDAPLVPVPFHTDEEPVMKIPKPDGWDRVTMMDSELIRYTMRNASLEKGGFAPTAVVTLESHPGLAEPREVFDAQQNALESGIGATDVHTTATTLCELPAETIDYMTPAIGLIPPHPARVVTAVLHTEDTTYLMTLTVQSADADDPTYRRDAETILTGFQMLPPSGS